MRRSFSALAVIGAALVTLTGCSAPASTEETPAASPTASESTLSGTVTVFAAASLTDVFGQIADEFMAANPGTDIAFSFGGSSDLVSQLIEGAPADVFASADQNNMAKAVEGGVIAGEPELFASNTLSIVVPAGNPAGVEDFADLAGEGVRVVVCAPQVPCGAATEKVEAETGVALAPVSEEQSVTDVLAKVSSGEADAGLVYVTDVKRAGDAVEGIAFDASAAAVNLYPIAVTRGAADPETAAAFVAFVLGDTGQRLLAAAGFGAAP
ncbi:molybdate ABC transporter substrate-binding protein [Amnibacterium flavum]|uniref:Molybdate ABC transporter substrate-binding protein n=1 Tax=Amnibacterium flavum TaxID=2173173 RepID=A0A2V1HU17_9MICO|nr:molybdate ABC transporter substrate-binding protein [Amnibacterium flavum]PVZ96068.1 molybdate ABC transporter substrate-binding protein [Amnibacterium flavum]